MVSLCSGAKASKLRILLWFPVKVVIFTLEFRVSLSPTSMKTAGELNRNRYGMTSHVDF